MVVATPVIRYSSRARRPRRIGLVAILTPHDQLGHEVVVVLAHPRGGLDPAIDADTGAAWFPIVDDLTWRWKKTAQGVLGIDPELDRVPTRLDRVEVDALALGDPKLPCHQIETGDHLGDRVFHLETGVHLEEVDSPDSGSNRNSTVPALTYPQERPAARAASARAVALLGGHARGGGLLDQLLVSSLHGAIALPEEDTVAGRVEEDLGLDVTGARQVFLDINLGASEVGVGFSPGPIESAQRARRHR